MPSTKERTLSPRPGILQTSSLSAAPLSSSYPSSQVSENEEPAPQKLRPFRFFGLPSELRAKIYESVFLDIPKVLDLDPDVFCKCRRSMNIFVVSRQMHNEACYSFYSSHSIRLFPCHPSKFFKAKVPLFGRLEPHCRSSTTTFELRLGPGFAAPPRGWVVNEALGLRDAVNVRTLNVMVQIDPSQPIFQGFRATDDGFYENFSKDLLNSVLLSVPSIIEVQFDAWPSVKKNGPMMRALRGVVHQHKKRISWGPECGWADANEGGEEDGEWVFPTSLAEAFAEIKLMA